MKPHIEARMNAVANYIIATHDSVRSCARVFGVSKSTVWRDCTLNMLDYNPELYCVLHNIFKVNKAHRKSGKVGK